MKILVIVHESLIPPDVVDESNLDREMTPWISEYDIISTLKTLNHDVFCLGISEDLRPLRRALHQHQPKIVFNLLEEFDGEAIFDQNIVSYLELQKIPYSGCNPRGLMIARDKAIAKKILIYHRIDVPSFQVFPRNQKPKKSKLSRFPLIVKCLNEEASLGISQASKVHSNDKLMERVHFLHNQYAVDVIAEEFIEGREFFVGVCGNYKLDVFPVWELFFSSVGQPEKEIYSSRAKFNHSYRHKKGISTGKAKISPELEKRIQKVAKRTYKALNLSGYARIDFRVSSDEKIYVIEANPNPDVSKLDDFASSAKKAGFDYASLIKKILRLGLQWNPTSSNRATE